RAQTLGRGYSSCHGCRSSFVALAGFEGTYARRSFTPGTGRHLPHDPSLLPDDPQLSPRLPRCVAVPGVLVGLAELASLPTPTRGARHPHCSCDSAGLRRRERRYPHQCHNVRLPGSIRPMKRLRRLGFAQRVVLVIAYFLALAVVALYVVTDCFAASPGAWFAYAPGTDCYFSVRRASVLRTVVVPIVLLLVWAIPSCWLLGDRRPPDQ